MIAGVFCMLRTTNVMKKVAWAWVLVATFYVFTPCLGQEDSYQEPTPKPVPSVFERLFGTSSSQTSQTPKPKAKFPASTTAGKTSRSGFLVPLKSFSKAFRGLSESEDAMEIEEDSPPRLIMPRVSKEPFRNLPSVQERRKLETVDLRVEKTTPVIQPPINYPRNPSKALMEHVLEWKLIHRTEDDLNRLYHRSYFAEPATRIQFEEQGINLFAECVKR